MKESTNRQSVSTGGRDSSTVQTEKVILALDLWVKLADITHHESGGALQKK